MLLLLTGLACLDKAEDSETDTDTAVEQEDTATDVEPFSPNEGHWTYTGGELIESGTTCALDDSTEGELTDPVGFNLTNDSGNGSFVIQSDNPEDNAVTCLMANDEGPDVTDYICGGSLVEQMIESVWEDDFGNDMDINMSIETAINGTFTSVSTLTNTFTLTLDCLSVDYAFPVSCEDINDQYPTPCTIQFTADASLDQ